MNLPGEKFYDPTMHWVHKWDSPAKIIATYAVTLMDDMRVIGGSEARCTGGQACGQEQKWRLKKTIST